jgi:hypothetical protein
MPGWHKLDVLFHCWVGSPAEIVIDKSRCTAVVVDRLVHQTWAQRTGASCAAEKTELTHLTRRKTVHGKGQIVINGQVIKPADTAKLLGVIFDQEFSPGKVG